jgi:hypothetical protein
MMTDKTGPDLFRETLEAAAEDWDTVNPDNRMRVVGLLHDIAVNVGIPYPGEAIARRLGCYSVSDTGRTCMYLRGHGGGHYSRSGAWND